MAKSLNLTARKPSKPTHKEGAAAALAHGVSQLHIKIPNALHRKLKMKAAEEGKTIRDYVIALLEKHGGLAT